MGWLGPMTHRQCLAWTYWLRDEWDRPSRSDWYVMQLNTSLARMFAKNPSSIEVKHFKLEFKDESTEHTGPMSEEEAMSHARDSEAIWLGAFGVTTADVSGLAPGESIQFSAKPDNTGRRYPVGEMPLDMNPPDETEE